MEILKSFKFGKLIKSIDPKMRLFSRRKVNKWVNRLTVAGIGPEMLLYDRSSRNNDGNEGGKSPESWLWDNKRSFREVRLDKFGIGPVRWLCFNERTLSLTSEVSESNRLCRLSFSRTSPVTRLWRHETPMNGVVWLHGSGEWVQETRLLEMSEEDLKERSAGRSGWGGGVVVVAWRRERWRRRRRVECSRRDGGAGAGIVVAE
ncbi:hypothetical protein Hanom_Chr16g01515081 [Helianthus anomalus]